MIPPFAVAFLLAANGTPIDAQFIGTGHDGLSGCQAQAAKIIEDSTTPQNRLPDGDYIVVVCTDPASGKSTSVELHPGQQKT